MLLGRLLVILTLACCAPFALHPAFLHAGWFPPAITNEALQYDRQFGWTLWICGFLFVALQLLLAWAVLRRSKRASAIPAASESRLELGWTVAAVVLFVAIALAGSRTWAKVPVRDEGRETIEVYAHQFAWNFRYTGPDGRFGRTSIDQISDSGGNPFGIDPADKRGTDDVVTATLRVPVGRDVLLILKSRDVIHDFFVRELRTKQDVVPGMEIPLEIHLARAGEYEIACAELCGLGHSQMRSLLIAMPPEDYDRWKRGE